MGSANALGITKLKGRCYGSGPGALVREIDHWCLSHGRRESTLFWSGALMKQMI